MLEGIQRREHAGDAVITSAGLTARDLRRSLPSADLKNQQQVKVQQVQVQFCHKESRVGKHHDAQPLKGL